MGPLPIIDSLIFICHSCKFSHDLEAYLKAKPHDLFWPKEPAPTLTVPPYLPSHVPEATDLGPSVDMSTTCPIFLAKGVCPYGFKCRFLGGHLERRELGNGLHGTLELIQDTSTLNTQKSATSEWNSVDSGVLRALKSRKVMFSLPPRNIIFIVNICFT